MTRSIKLTISISIVVAMIFGLAGCGVVNSGTTEYNELVALVQGVHASAANFQLVTDTQYAKIQAKTQITKDYYDAVSNSGEVWTGNFRSQADALTELLKNYRDENGQPLDPTKLNLAELQGKGALPNGLGQGFTLYVNAITQAPPPTPRTPTPPTTAISISHMRLLMTLSSDSLSRLERPPSPGPRGPQRRRRSPRRANARPSYGRLEA